MIAHVCNPRASTVNGEGWGAGEFQEAHGPASSWTHRAKEETSSQTEWNTRADSQGCHLSSTHLSWPAHAHALKHKRSCHTYRESKKKYKEGRLSPSVHESEGQTWEEASSLIAPPSLSLATCGHEVMRAGKHFELHCEAQAVTKQARNLQFHHVPLKKQSQGEAATGLYMPCPQIDKGNVAYVFQVKNKTFKEVHL